MLRQLALVIASTLAFNTVSAAQTAATQPTLPGLDGFAEDYRIGPNDLLEIMVVDNPEFDQSLRVLNSGELSLPMVGRLQVAGLTAFEVEEVIATRLREEQLLTQAEVLVFVRDYQAKPVYVMGAVFSPGELIMSQDLTVTEAILLAGGLDFNADVKAFIHRRLPGSGGRWPSADTSSHDPTSARPGTTIIEVDIESLLEGRIIDNDPGLERGDVLIIPTRPMNAFFVVGEVFDPRNYFYPADRPITASQAISWAAGPLPTAKLSDGMLVRYDDNDQRVEMEVDYSAILEGRQGDIPLQNNDLIFIPGSNVKTITQGLLGMNEAIIQGFAFRAGRRFQRRASEPDERQ